MCRFLLIFLLSCCTDLVAQKASADLKSVSFSGKPKNIILMIGDGMGLSQVSAHWYWEGPDNIFRQFSTIGFHTSHSADNLVTDSAAGATAFSCGLKTTKGSIGIYHDEAVCGGI